MVLEIFEGLCGEWELLILSSGCFKFSVIDFGAISQAPNSKLKSARVLRV